MKVVVSRHMMWFNCKAYKKRENGKTFKKFRMKDFAIEQEGLGHL